MVRNLNAVVLFFTLVGLVGCAKSLTSSLLSSSGNSCTDFSCTTGEASDTTSAPTINPNSSLVLSRIDASDTVEISGSCQDYKRRNNRILVQVYAGETIAGVDPFINNDIGNECLVTTNAVKAGVEAGDLKISSYVIMGFSQSFAFTASGGVAPYTFSIFSGAGVMNAVTGVYTSAASNGINIIRVSDSSATPYVFTRTCKCSRESPRRFRPQ